MLVFDVSQTDGKPIPELEAKELLSDVEGYKDMIHAVEAVSPVPIEMEEIAGESKGYFDREARRIAVQENMRESQTLKTMIHEVAHSMLHNKEGEQDEQARKDRNTKEVEAESIAYMRGSTMEWKNSIVKKKRKNSRKSRKHVLP